MGRTFHFHCTHCAYHADLSGGADAGVNCDVQTIRCHECRELFDVFTRVRRPAESQEYVKKFSALGRREIPPVILRGRPPRRLEWQTVKLACPRSDKHFVEPWKNPGRCPRCHAFMEPVGLPFRLWE